MKQPLQLGGVYLREHGAPSTKSEMSAERASNPFLVELVR